MTVRSSLIVVIVAALLAGAALVSIRRLKIDTSLASLFDENDASAQALVRVLDHFSAVEELLLLVQTPADQPADSGKLTTFAARLESAIAKDARAASLSGGVSYKVDAQMRGFFEQVLVPNAIFYLDDDAFAAARKRLTRNEMAAQIRRNETLISTPGPAADALAKAILKDPLRLHEFLLARIAKSIPMTGGSDNSGAFLSRDGRALLVRVRGKRPVSDLDFSREFTAVIHKLADEVNTDHLIVDFSGAYAIAARSEQAIRHDMIGSVVSSVIFLQLLFLLAFRRPIRSFLLAFLPVALGVLYGFGVYALFARALTPMTASIGGILAGMAIDYAIAYLAFFHTRRASGMDSIAAAQSTRRILMTAIIAAWATSVAGFVVIGFSHVKALRDFSLMGGLGLTGAFLCAIVILPAMLVLIDRSSAAKRSPSRITADRFLPMLANQRRPILALTIAIFAVALIVIALPGPILPLESDLSVMHPRPNAPLDAQETIAQKMGTSPGSLVVHLHASNDDQLLRLAHQVDGRIQRGDVRSAGVVGAFGLASLLPDPAIAPARVSATGKGLADQVVADFKSVIADSIFDAASYRPYEEFLERLLTSTRPPGITDLMRYPRLAETILPSSATRANTPPTEAITLLFLRDATEKRESRDAVVNAVRSALADLPGVTLTGISVLNHDTEQTVRRDLPRLVLISLSAVTLYLALHLRNLADCLLAMLPTIFSFACLLAFMRLSGQKLNMINLIAFPLLIGIDVDYGIFLVSAARRRDIKNLSRQQVIDRLAPAASAVLLCAATTLLGFGSLAFTSVPAAQSLGRAVAVGVASCAFAALLLVVPLCFVLHARDGDNGTNA